VAENRTQHCPSCSRAVVADTVGVTLKRQLDIAVAKQSLYCFRIGFNADQKRCQAVTQIVEAESPRVFTLLHELAHVMLNEPGICDMHESDDSGTDLEPFCNSVAGAALFPRTELLASGVVRQHPKRDLLDR
jgi:Zn-dependent peptidase ImmA (M78 family)